MYAPASQILRFALLLVMAWAAIPISLASIVRAPFDEHSSAVLRNGRIIVLEVNPPDGAGETFFVKYLAESNDRKNYANKGAVALRFADLNPQTQRNTLLALFRQDIVDEKGWRHVAILNGGERETLWAIAEWLTGSGNNHEKIAQLNDIKGGVLNPGQEVIIPFDLLVEVMREPTTERLPAIEEGPVIPEEQENLGDLAAQLSFTKRERDSYAVYRLKPGEALYTAVVVRFTDIRENVDILRACDVIQKESLINDVTDMDPGTEIYIPIDLLADRFKPESNPDRQEYESILAEANRLRGQVRTKDLEGVVVILDSGHGGKDKGTSATKNGFTIYEDEVTYDVACRIRRLLQTQTRAKVHMTMLDPDQGFEPVDTEHFPSDSDEKVLVTPNYPNADAKVSANLRWYLANSIYRREVNGGADPRKIIFTSIHFDALFDGRLRGTMVYIPGAAHRRENERGGSMAVYGRYVEVQESPEVKSTSVEHRRDEALSRNFAATLLDELGKARIKRHSVGDPIRNVIRQSGGKQYVPAVLRNTLVPTKVLVECANLTNPIDCKWASQPWWRERYAEAYVAALKAHYR
ncbi:MAG: N-acetylmuramoyl-L-alanine amidase [Candidatus Hydrogenedentes bacterium]|nr:N-acetylmuramoyl-L-alanine amidase [Candidatus Hydrogenedentota bacterium]